MKKEEFVFYSIAAMVVALLYIILIQQKRINALYQREIEEFAYAKNIYTEKSKITESLSDTYCEMLKASFRVDAQKNILQENEKE